MIRLPAVLFLAGLLYSQTADPAWEALDSAYKALESHLYDKAIQSFERAAGLAPSRADIRKNLAYTYLKVGETELARDQFAEAVRLDPADTHVAREYAFLCFETRREAEARRVFKRLAESGDTASAEVFQRIDRELAEGIERWTRAVDLTPSSFSAHEELARLADRRDRFALAARHYEAAWKLRPAERKFLLDLGRVWKQQGDAAKAAAALLAASRGAEPRVAEAARELLGDRYPWVSEFRTALDLDPQNHALRRELAFLLLEMKNGPEAEAEFRKVIEHDAGDSWAAAQLGFLLLARGERDEALPLLRKILEGTADDDLKDRIRTALKLPQELRKRSDVAREDAAAEARKLAAKSLDAGYLKDAARYLRVVHENDPLDWAVLLKLGWTFNLLHDDREAVEWFRLARRSPDPKIAAEATKAYDNLKQQFATWRTSVWLYPMYSSRWQDLFSWAQYKTEWRPSARVHPYVSVRFAGDTRRTAQTSSPAPAFLSESAVIAGAGLTTNVFHGVRAWVEAGYGFTYLRQGDAPRVRPDVRGGVSLVRSMGKTLSAETGGVFAETTADALFISRFDRDTILYAQNRAGYTLGRTGPARFQFTWNLNLTTDLRRFGWANSMESGPGLRVKLALPRPVVLSIDALSGRYTIQDGTRPPTYSDLRIGLWYAFSR